MKTTGTMNGGTIQSGFVSSCKDRTSSTAGSVAHSNYLLSDPTYLLKAVQGFKNQGINIYAVSVQVCVLFDFHFALVMTPSNRTNRRIATLHIRRVP
jgi:O-glycosyl hydrolase